MGLPLRPRYFTANEVCVHNTADDLWVSFLDKVYDLTPLCEKYKGIVCTTANIEHCWCNVGNVLLKPIIQSAGKDISHWFNSKTKDIRTYVDPVTHCVLPYTPHGQFVHVPPPYPSSDWANNFGLPWWKDDIYFIGYLSKKTRFINIVNTLTSQEHVVEVCSEETISEILLRYLPYNAHAASYTWKYDGQDLDMEKTLAENGIADEDEKFYNLRIDERQFLCALHVYYNDDLTEA